MIVEPEPDVLEILVASLSRRFNAYITCAKDAETCLQAILTEPHDLIITELELDGLSGLQLAEQLSSLGTRPMILLGDHVTCSDAVAAMRLGVRDIFRKPFAVAELLDAAEQMIRQDLETRRRAARYHRLRDLVRQVVRERRDLDRRVELVCKDLVDAHRRLARRVAEVKASHAN
jgi:DNA-binding NtrC family response regulator